MNKFQFNYNKTLKLTNARIMELGEEDFENINLVVEKMENYIKAKGYMPVGPLIQYSGTKINEAGELDISRSFSCWCSCRNRCSWAI